MITEKIRAYSVLGNIAIVNFPNDYSKKKKIEFAKLILNGTSKAFLSATRIFLPVLSHQSSKLTS